MSIGRRCRSCEAPSVHRSQRSLGQRALAWLVPVRPQHCVRCGHKSWGLLHADDGVAPYVTAGALWLLVLVAVFPRNLMRTPERAGAMQAAAGPLVQRENRRSPQATAAVTPGEESVQVRSAAAPAPTSWPSAIADVPTPAASSIEAVSVSASASESTAAAPAPTTAPEAHEKQLDGLDVRWTGEAMELMVRSRGELPHALQFSAKVGGYVLDLPGRWQLPAGLRASRTFTRSNLSALRVGRHDEFLRIVLTLRDPSAPQPLIEPGEAGLRLLIR